MTSESDHAHGAAGAPVEPPYQEAIAAHHLAGAAWAAHYLSHSMGVAHGAGGGDDDMATAMARLSSIESRRCCQRAVAGYVLGLRGAVREAVGPGAVPEHDHLAGGGMLPVAEGAPREDAPAAVPVEQAAEDLAETLAASGRTAAAIFEGGEVGVGELVLAAGRLGHIGMPLLVEWDGELRPIGGMLRRAGETRLVLQLGGPVESLEAGGAHARGLQRLGVREGVAWAQHFVEHTLRIAHGAASDPVERIAGAMAAAAGAESSQCCQMAVATFGLGLCEALASAACQSVPEHDHVGRD